MNAKELYGIGNDLFSKRSSLLSLWQEVADNFYPERADFTVRRSLGTDFASNLMTSYPVQCRRDLGNQFGVMLRPTARSWFHMGRRFEEKDEPHDIKKWLDYFEKVQRRAMYDPISMFSRATKEGDHDFAAFGQCVLSIEPAMTDGVGQHLLYRCWHLRDMAWQENERGQIQSKWRKWSPTAQQACRTFTKVHQKLSDLCKKTPFDTVNLIHMVVPADMWDGPKIRQPYYSIWYDIDNDFVMEEVGNWTGIYVIPRWQTVSGSQYSYSPATVAALPDARLIQAMTFTLLEAGEKATSPPMIATKDAVRGDVSLYAGGITWVDMEYDERLGDALRPISQDLEGFRFGLQMNQDTRQMINSAFYLNKLSMPERAPEMTAYEVGQRVQEYIRNALPIFEPLEAEYNASVCNMSFDLLMRHGAFGDPRSWPKELLGADIEFRFESPLHDAIDQQLGHKMLEARALLADAAAADPSALALWDASTALREALNGIGVPASWIRSKEDVERIQIQQAEEAQAQQGLAEMEQASTVAKNLGVQAGTPGAPMPVPDPMQAMI